MVRVSMGREAPLAEQRVYDTLTAFRSCRSRTLRWLKPEGRALFDFAHGIRGQFSWPYTRMLVEGAESTPIAAWISSTSHEIPGHPAG